VQFTTHQDVLRHCWSTARDVLESYRAALRRRIKVTHPNLFSFLSHLQAATVDQMHDLARIRNGLNIGRPKRKSNIVNESRMSVEVRCRRLQSSPVLVCRQPFGRRPHGSVAASHRQRQRRRRRRAVDGVYCDDFNGSVPCCSSGR